MKLFSFVCLLLAASLHLCADDTRPVTPKASEKLAPILWMLGDWQAVEHGDDGDLKVYLHAELALNGQAIVYHVEFEKGGRLTPKYQGMYYWSPAKKSLVITQVSSDGNVGEGTYVPTGADQADQLVTVTTPSTTFELKSSYRIEKKSFHFKGLFRPAGKTEFMPGVESTYQRVGDATLESAGTKK